MGMAPIKEINPPVPLTDAAREEIEALVHRQKAANGVLMRAINLMGDQLESGLKVIPATARAQLDEAAKVALTYSYQVAEKSRSGRVGRLTTDPRLQKAMAAVSGALGGVGGLPTALAELPVATTMIFRAVQDVAAQYGEDPTSQSTRIECLRVFGAGGPDDADDGVDTAFISARLTISGVAINSLINKIAPRFAAVLGQKLASQAVPVLGAVAGAGTNYAFINYYSEVAHVHFGLRRLAREFGEEQVTDEFHRLLHRPKKISA